MDSGFNFLSNGMRPDPGYRFYPTDEELIFHYLYKKVLSLPLPAYFIPELDVCQFDPWLLPGDNEQERYFFTKIEPTYPIGNRSNMAAGNGFWKAAGIEDQIDVVSDQIQLVGLKRTHVFYVGISPNGTKTEWIMHEYRLADFPMDSWVLCRIFMKKSCRKQKIAAAPEPAVDWSGATPASISYT